MSPPGLPWLEYTPGLSGESTVLSSPTLTKLVSSNAGVEDVRAGGVLWPADPSTRTDRFGMGGGARVGLGGVSMPAVGVEADDWRAAGFGVRALVMLTGDRLSGGSTGDLADFDLWRLRTLGVAVPDTECRLGVDAKPDIVPLEALEAGETSLPAFCPGPIGGMVITTPEKELGTALCITWALGGWCPGSAGADSARADGSTGWVVEEEAAGLGSLCQGMGMARTGDMAVGSSNLMNRCRLAKSRLKSSLSAFLIACSCSPKLTDEEDVASSATLDPAADALTHSDALCTSRGERGSSRSVDRGLLTTLSMSSYLSSDLGGGGVRRNTPKIMTSTPSTNIVIPKSSYCCMSKTHRQVSVRCIASMKTSSLQHSASVLEYMTARRRYRNCMAPDCTELC
eukprot:scaffold400527_cov44-Prasinocladus_malaysianus.AAC.1